jgi:hypothetical protein
VSSELVSREPRPEDIKLKRQDRGRCGEQRGGGRDKEVARKMDRGSRQPCAKAFKFKFTEMHT